MYNNQEELKDSRQEGMEKLHAKNCMLKAENKRKQMEIDFLKKFEDK